ncbi:MAG: hypothetical protein ACXW1U_16695 [Methylobacter sp.]
MKPQICLNLDLLTKEEREYLDELKRDGYELIVPIALWNGYLKEYAPVEKYFNAYERDHPPYRMLTDYIDYVIVDRSWFYHLMETRLRSLYYKVIRLTRDQGGVYFLDKLEPKKRMPKYDIFNAGIRVPGSFRSRG